MNPRLLHLALAPLYTGLLAGMGALLMGVAPATALIVALAAVALLFPPIVIVLAGIKLKSPRLMRASLLAIIGEVLAAGFFLSPGRSADYGVTKLDVEKTKRRLHEAAQVAFPDVVKTATEISKLGSRQTGSAGLEKTFDYVRRRLTELGWTSVIDGNAGNLGAAPPEHTVRVTQFPVLAPVDHGCELVFGSGGEQTRVQAFGLMPNSVQPCATPLDGIAAPLVYLGSGADSDFDGKTISGKIAVFEFDSRDRWRLAYEQGAVGAVFLGSPSAEGETLRQADEKYLALVPLHFPRVYIGTEAADAIRQIARLGAAATLHCRMALAMTQAPVLEALIPGTQSKRELLIMTHADARSIAPALSFGGQETFSIATWLALFDHFSKTPPAFSLRFVLTSGHWQTQSSGRGYAYSIKGAVGEQIAMGIGVDLNPEAEAVIVTDENVADAVRPSQYWWLKKLLFTVDRREPGWLDQLEALSDRPQLDRGDTPSKYLIYGGRPSLPGSQWSLWLAPVDQWPPLSHAASFPTANQSITQLGSVSIAFQTCCAYRQRHFTCVDTIDPWLPKVENLKPQLEVTFALLGALADLDPARFPTYKAEPFRGYGGYNQVDVQVLHWNPAVLWYDKAPPKNQHTYALLVPRDSRFQRGHSYAYWPRPLAPNRHTHRLLQCMQTIYVSEADGTSGRAAFQNVQCAWGEIVYDALAFTLDESGHLTHAFDQGLHGDGEFKFLDRPLSSANALFQTPVFACGSVVISALLDHDRGNVTRQAEHEYRQQWGLGNDQDDGEVPFIPIRAVNEVGTHTSADSYAWIQYRDTAMVFLKPGQRCEILAGGMQGRQVIFNDDSRLRSELEEQAKRDGAPLTDLLARLDREAADMKPTTRKPTPSIVLIAGETPAVRQPEYIGFRVEAGEERRINEPKHASYEQLAEITRNRMAQYANLNVKSPTAELFQKRADEHEAAGRADRENGRIAAATAEDALAWSDQSHAYQHTFRLLMDVVTTTIFYFLLLVPFGFLVERLLFPQLSLPCTCFAVAAIFLTFAGLLYCFHPGFHLATNVFVTLVCFVIVILTLPALIIIAVRGAKMLMEPGARFKRRHSADAERWGVLASALSLAVNNMRRRKLRTGLTLSTITVLVTSLVLLTSTTADTYFDHEKHISPLVPSRGIQVTNTYDHTHGMSEAAAAIMRATYSDRADVVFRQYFNPGFEASISCYALNKATPAGTTGRRFAVRGAIGLEAIETRISKIDRAIARGRYFTNADVHACLLADDVAKQMNLEIGDKVRCLGVELVLVGTLRSSDIDGGIVDVSSRPVTPQAFYRPSLTVDTPDHLMASETLFVPSALLREDIPAPFPTFSVVIVPRPPDDAAIFKRAAEIDAIFEKAKSDDFGELQDKLMRAAGGKLNASECAWLAAHAAHAEDTAVRRDVAAFNSERLAIKTIAEEIAAEHANVDVYMTNPAAPWEKETGGADRVELISAFARVSLKSGSFLVLPFIVSFFMLLAIMIGNVYERRQEIHVFSSVGLAPKHVAGMFLAEALVYAGIASVLGYFIGIILLDVFRRAGWLPPDFHPNYFGKVVIWSAVLATTSSLLSVLYPMRIAALMVNPSLERIWRIATQPAGDHWSIPLPFVAHGMDEVVGVLQFAREFLGHHCGERTGAFTMESDPALAHSADDAVLSGKIWLAPFERNLVQDIRIVPRREADKNRYHFMLESTRLTGPDYLWRKSNHAFVDGLRKQMLIWHSLGQNVTQEYINAGKSAVAAPPADPSPARGGETGVEH